MVGAASKRKREREREREGESRIGSKIDRRMKEMDARGTTYWKQAAEPCGALGRQY